VDEGIVSKHTLTACLPHKINVLESNRTFFVKNDRLAAEVLTLTQESRDSTPSRGANEAAK
jgi:hypothetical protein